MASLVSVVGVEGLPTRKSSEGKMLSEASSTAEGMANSADVCDAQIWNGESRSEAPRRRRADSARNFGVEGSCLAASALYVPLRTL